MPAPYIHCAVLLRCLVPILPRPGVKGKQNGTHAIEVTEKEGANPLSSLSDSHRNHRSAEGRKSGMRGISSMPQYNGLENSTDICLSRPFNSPLPLRFP